nr:uncharacterized protein LOC128701951 [Cherax quadricarinatus]
MQVQQSSAEVRYTLTIPQLSSYRQLSQTFTSDFPLSVNGVRTSWRLTLTPFLKDSGCDSHDPINCNVGLSLECLKCSIYLPDIEVHCSVAGRDQHEKKLARSSGDGLKWQGILVTRVALRVFKLLEDDVLTANLRFVVCGSDLTRAVDSLENLSRQLVEIHKTGIYSDVEIVTSDGDRLPAHRAVLHARSNLLQKTQKKPGSENISATPLADQGTPKGESNPPRTETPINSTFGSMSSQGCHSVTFVSPDSSNSNTCRTVLTSTASHTPTKVTFAQHATISPARCLFSPNKTPSKRALTPNTASPSKRLLTHSTPSGKHTHTPSNSSVQGAHVTKNARTPCKKLYHNTADSRDYPQMPATLDPEPFSAGCDSYSPTSASRTPLKQLDNHQLSDTTTISSIKVHMSGTVTRQLLQWIYTGDCCELGRLARPLLVAGLRHEVKDLSWACEDHLAAALTPTSTPDMLMLAHKYGSARLQEAALQYALHHAAEVTAEPSWALLAVSAPALIVEFSRRLAHHAHTRN